MGSYLFCYSTCNTLKRYPGKNPHPFDSIFPHPLNGLWCLITLLPLSLKSRLYYFFFFLCFVLFSGPLKDLSKEIMSFLDFQVSYVDLFTTNHFCVHTSLRYLGVLRPPRECCDLDGNLRFLRVLWFESFSSRDVVVPFTSGRSVYYLLLVPVSTQTLEKRDITVVRKRTRTEGLRTVRSKIHVLLVFTTPFTSPDQFPMFRSHILLIWVP